MNKNRQSTTEAVIGCAFNYSTEAVLPFLNSLEKSGFTGDLVLFINDRSSIEAGEYSYTIRLINPDRELQTECRKIRFTKRVLDKFRAGKLLKSIVFRLVKTTLQKDRNLDPWLVAYFYSFYNLMTHRFFLYYFFLKQSGYRSILFSDVTDVIFQRHPLSLNEGPGLHVFGENDAFVIGDIIHNTRWIKEAFGEEVFREMEHSPIYCAGTIIAKDETVFDFLKDFINIVLDYHISPRIEGIDQGVFNYMISYLKKPYFRLHPNGDHVFTMDLQPEQEIVYTGGKLFMKGKEGTLPSIVHQYNRHENLDLRIREQFA